MVSNIAGNDWDNSLTNLVHRAVSEKDRGQQKNVNEKVLVSD